MTAYTVYSSTNGTVYGRGLSATAAAEIILTHDGHEYEIRAASDGFGFDLFVSRGSRNSYGGTRGFTRAWRGDRLIDSANPDREEAWKEIAAQVVTVEWSGHPEAMTDTDYDAMLIEANDAEANHMIYYVTMESSLYGSEDFGPYASLKEANDAEARLRSEAWKRNDGIERTFKIEPRAKDEIDA